MSTYLNLVFLFAIVKLVVDVNRANGNISKRKQSLLMAFIYFIS